MSKVICEREDLVNIADAIRNQTGTTQTMTISEMAEAILNICGNGIVTPPTVALIKGVRYSLSGGGFKTSADGAASLVVPVVSIGASIRIEMTNMVSDDNYPNVYYGTDKITFDNQASDTSVLGGKSYFDVNDIPAGKWYIVFHVDQLGADHDFSNAGIKIDGMSAKIAITTNSTVAEFGKTEGGVDYTVPTYHYIEAFEVAQKIDAFKKDHANNFVFGTITDNHVYANNETYEKLTKASVLHGAFALETVGAMVGADFVANLGDNCWENGSGTDNAYEGSLYTVNVTKPMHERLTSFSLVGNHDKNESSQTLYDLIGQYNDFDVKATTQIRCFGYKDFTNKKVRVIALNTCDYLNSNDGGFAFSYEQKDFLMRALDLSSKSDYASWGIILLSHFPIDWNGGNYNTYGDIQAILKAYEDGTTASITVNSSYAFRETPSGYATYSSGKLVYNYSGKNSARIIANIHGHVHTDSYGKLANLKTVRMASPNTCFYLGKTESYPDYGDYSISTAISRTANTVTDTSATFYCIDLDAQEIYSYSFGAGNDRSTTYKDAIMYSITYNLVGVSSSTDITMLEQGEFFKTNLSVNEGYTMQNMKVTMGGIDVTSSVYNSSNNTITIDEVTGNVVITATANEALVTETITPYIAPRSSWYNQLVGGVLNLANSNTECALGVSKADSYSYTDRNSNTFYLMPIDSKYCKATLNYSATDGLAVRYYLQVIKDNGGTFTSVKTVGKGTDNVITWDKGAADYLLISIEHSDGATKWDWESTGKTITVTFSNH